MIGQGYSMIFARSRVILQELNKVLPSTLWSQQLRSGRLAAMASIHSFTHDVFQPPADIMPSNSIDKEAFKKTATIPALKVNKRCIHKVLKAFKMATFSRPRFAVIREVLTNPDEKFFLLDPQNMCDLEAMTERQQSVLKENDVEERLHEYTLELTYKDWQPHEVLQRLLPDSVEVPTGFSRVGHIMHLNLRQAQLEHKKLIGEVLLEKTPGIKTVVNKLNEIDNTYRFFNMECIAGEPDTVVTVKENHVAYSFDFAKVYWNPRLSTEHQRIIEKLHPTDVVYDMFAGVGPFAIPAAKKGCEVHANDLNPESFRWLEVNAKQNKLSSRLKASNLDGRQFAVDIVKPDLITKAKEGFKYKAHIIMNLPAIAVEFLDIFPSLLSLVPSELKDKIPEVVVHCHGFSKSDKPAEDIQSRVEDILKCRLNCPEIHDVRDVAPNKEMMCISFSMPSTILCAPTNGDIGGAGDHQTEHQTEQSGSAEGSESDQDGPAIKKPRTH
ncbi:tRNA (guanine(37)-N1)-methyltransferase isoform X1 [Strongylocentrotus purpuratus]|uniref:tRNA (guanine(37)-N1)-methyltransferase n=1 Tax=Strongylocentrotus purpuratus TaxID=7668 RepID=A0A7M7RAM6_STRPU|nr:tRNA (guanine(37)-N1)-methyltransferase isoform X1 [Strongylocentrotus purpuratus]XP_784079.3 tRNA (guanine(37)-N1)-methyltransferase isoform X1 [Strongylocentrotus purpuratus]|eukprot:XP_011675403.1 PREDICTED: tRNA (guanine(37)-N1)-methyltransferase [Strongylocentrotus purpuratus]